jgi:hypothetical protein
MRKLNLGPTDILVVNFPNHTRADAALVCRDIIEILKEAGIDIPLNRILPLPEGATLSKVCGPMPESKLRPSVDALAQASAKVQAEADRWKFVARGGNNPMDTPDLLDAVSALLWYAAFNGGATCAQRDILADMCTSRAAFVRSHLKNGG